MKRPDAAIGAATALFIVYALTLAPGVTFWDAGEFIAAARVLGIPHPPGTPLFVFLEHVWAQALAFLPYAMATNLFSAASTALAAGITARVVERATGRWEPALAAALVAGGMTSVWLNATETEVYAASLALGVLMIWSGDRAGRSIADERTGARWTWLTAYLMMLAVPLHLSALVAAPAAIVLAARSGDAVRWRRALVLFGVLVLAMGVGRMSWILSAAGVLIVLASSAVGERRDGDGFRYRLPVVVLAVSCLAVTALALMLVRARFDPAINQGDPATLGALADAVARRQYAVSPIWPRMAPLWVQLGNLGQYADWQVALSLGPTVLPSVGRTLFTAFFLALGYAGAIAHWRTDRRSWLGVLTLFVCGTLGVLVYLNLHAGPSIGYGILPASVAREARERDYFFVFGFWAWGMWAGIGAVAFARRLSRPAWAGVVIACLPLALNWRAVTRRAQPEAALPLTVAEAYLGSAPRTAVLFVVGDNDSYPLWYAQEVLGLRTDVTVVTVPLLPTRWAREQVAGRSHLLSADEVRRFSGSIETAKDIAAGARALGRPVAVANTMTARERAIIGPAWSASGLVFVERPDTAPPMDSAATARWARWVHARLGTRPPRDAIDPVNSYYRRLLDCPRQLVSAEARTDSSQLDSVCNYP